MSGPPKSLKNNWVLVPAIALVLAGGLVWGLMRWSNNGPWIAPPEARDLANPVPLNTPSVTAGKAIYADRCERCHGEEGRGDGPDASLYKTPPGVLSDAQAMGQQTDGEIFWKIGDGRRPMPGFAKELTDRQRWQLVDFIRSLAKR